MCCFRRCSQGTAPLHTQHIKENHDTPKEKRTPYVTNFSVSARLTALQLPFFLMPSNRL